MKRSPLLLFFLSLIISLSSQNQLFRDLAGATVQNLQAQASQWTLTDPLGANHPIPITECLESNIVYKPDSLPKGTTFTKTFDNLEDHSMLRFYVQMYYMGNYTSQTVNIKFDQVSLGTSEVKELRYFEPIPPCSSSQALNGYIVYFGSVSHTDSSVTVEFSTNFHNADVEVTWGLRNFSLVTDTSIPIESSIIHAYSPYSQSLTLPYYFCNFNTYLNEDGNCAYCSSPCQECYESDPDQCFTYPPSTSENRLCPEGQTLLDSGCTNCPQDCNVCDLDVNKCDTCLTTCAQCDNSAQCQLCTFESNLVLFEGSCIESCPQGTYADSENKCQPCQQGCLDCTGLGQCSQCSSSETTNIDGYCICPQPRTYFEEESGACTGTCLSGCEKCVSSDTCLACDSGTTLQSNGDCRCDNNGFYYQDDSRSCTGQCFEYCDYCHDSSSCLVCSENRVPQDGICKCAPPRVLIGTSCECPSFMSPDPFFSTCEYSSSVDFSVQTTISPLFDAVLVLHTNPHSQWTSISYQWVVSCQFENPDTQDQFDLYMASQNTNVLLIPSRFLENDLRCSLQATVLSGMLFLISPGPSFRTVSTAHPQVNIVGGPFQILNPTKLNLIFAQIQSSIGKSLPPSGLNIAWTQTGGDQLDMSKLFDSSDPYKLTIPKCTLAKGKLYSFKLTVQLKINPGAQVSQDITIGAYAPKFQAKINQPDNNYHLLAESLALNADLSFLESNECGQAESLSEFLDLSTAMYTWECRAIDLQLSSSGRILDELQDITDDSNVFVHPDPLKLFYRSTNSPSLTVPSSYFTDYSGYQFIFYLTVTIQSKVIEMATDSLKVQRPLLEILKSKTSLHVVSSQPFTTPSFTCISENNCQAYSADFPTKFIGSNFNPQYSYNWLVNTLDPRKYTTFLTLFNKQFADQSIVPRILYTVTDGTNVASAFMTLPWNNPPQNGYINIFPTEGEAYKTKFFISAYGWTDADLPLSYQFFTTYIPDAYLPVRNKLLSTFVPYGFTPVIPAPSLTYNFLSVIIQDNLKSTSIPSAAVVFLSGTAQNFCEAVDKSSQALAQSKISDSFLDRFRLISVILENLAKWEKEAFDSACGAAASEFKFVAITEMKEIVQTLGSKEDLKLIVLENLVWSAYPEVNQDQNFNLYTNIVDSLYQPGSSSLAADEYKQMLVYTDYLIWCMKKPGTSVEDPNRIFAYINMLLRSTLSKDTIPTDDAVAYQGTFYTYFTTKTTYCRVLQGVTRLTDGYENNLQANVTLRPNQQIPPEKCSSQINMIYMAFKSNYTLKNNGFVKNIVYFDLIDSLTGKSVLDIFTYVLESPILICPVGYICVPNGGGGTEIYGIFDLRNQINKIFVKSNIDQIQNISVLAHFKFWKSVAFWTVLGFSIWFLLSIYWLYVKHPTYCALTSKKTKITKESLFKKINLFFWVIHPLVGIYIYNDLKTTKPVKLAIYYQRLIVVLVFSTIFSSLDKGEDWIFKGYIILFNTATVTPTNSFFSRLFEWTFKAEDSKKKNLTSKIKLYTGIIFYLALLVICFLVIFIIEAQQDASQNKTWAFNFVIAFVQDLSLSPAISALNKVLFIKFPAKNKLVKRLKSEKIQRLILSQDFKSIYETIFTTLSTKESLRPERITTLAPMSTNARLTKLATLDLHPALSAKNSINREFRSRAASETEINSVDFGAAETTIQNRFQTLLAEAKAENIRKTSPIKQGLQTTKSSIVNFPLASSEKQDKPFTTIEFNVKESANISLEDIFNFAEHPDGEGDHPSQLKLYNNISARNSQIHDKKKKKDTVISSLHPSVELSLEQRNSEKNNLAVKNKSTLKHTEPKPFHLMDLSSMNQFKEQSALHPEELSSFDGEETLVSMHKSKIKEPSKNKNKKQIHDKN